MLRLLPLIYPNSQKCELSSFLLPFKKREKALDLSDSAFN